jgi:hypothetical protein
MLKLLDLSQDPHMVQYAMIVTNLYMASRRAPHKRWGAWLSCLADRPWPEA